MATVAADTPAVTRRRNSSGESTRVMLMEVAERLFATKGIEAVTLREIQQAAGQSNTSVIRYHFGSRDGLIRALISYRQASLGADRQEMLASMREEGKEADPRAVVWLLARPLANSIAAGEMFAAITGQITSRTSGPRSGWRSSSTRRFRTYPSGSDAVERSSSTSASSTCWLRPRAPATGSAKLSCTTTSTPGWAC
jgi:AcrR family transcriptional regulator